MRRGERGLIPTAFFRWSHSEKWSGGDGGAQADYWVIVRWQGKGGGGGAAVQVKEVAKSTTDLVFFVFSLFCSQYTQTAKQAAVVAAVFLVI